MCIRKSLPVLREESQHVKNVRNWLNALDKQDGKTDGIIDVSVWSKYESKFGIKSERIHILDLYGRPKQEHTGVLIENVISVIKAKRGEE